MNKKIFNPLDRNTAYRMIKKALYPQKETLLDDDVSGVFGDIKPPC